MKENNASTLLDDLPPGGQTRFSTISGSIGNYGMYAAAGVWAVTHGYAIATKKPDALKFNKATFFGLGTVLVGSALGALHGVNEANNIQGYREAVANKIDTLSRELQGNREKIAELTQAVQAKAEGRESQHAR